MQLRKDCPLCHGDGVLPLKVGVREREFTTDFSEFQMNLYEFAKGRFCCQVCDSGEHEWACP